MQKAKEQRRPLSGVNGEVRSKKDLTGPTLLEMSSACPDPVGVSLRLTFLVFSSTPASAYRIQTACPRAVFRIALNFGKVRTVV
jgi:hypothetical protein